MTIEQTGIQGGARVIPNEAVDAAAKAIADGLRTKSIADLARAALEAAAPHMFADLLAFAEDRDKVYGSIRSHVTTYELRKLLGAEE